MGGELERTRHAISTIRQELDRVASGDLAGDAQQLGEGMHKLGAEMGQAGASVEQMRIDLEMMAQRFRHFNEPGAQDTEWGQAKLKRLP